MTLCKLCKSISLNNLPSLPSEYYNGRPEWKYIHAFYGPQENMPSSKPLGLPHWPTIETLRSSAAKCELCALILSSVEKVIAEISDTTAEKWLRYNSCPAHLTFDFWIVKRPDGGDGFWVLTRSDGTDAIGSHKVYFYLVAAIGICVKEGDPLAPSTMGRPVEENPNSQTTLTRAVNWVNECNEHPKCSAGKQPLPTRIIDVGDMNRPCVRLVETSGEVGIYATLSHCWGTSMHLTSTRSSLAARKKGIDFSEMPKTFQDAVTIARAVGVRFIWIDSLCIMQDDGEDWERESANMTSVYSNSYLTIAATSAEDSSVGCFSLRPPKRYVNIDYTSKEGISGEVLAFLLPIQKEALNDFYITMEEEPLTKRAWALQERVLARRTLHFGKHQMYFECNNGFIGENGLRFKERYNSVHTPPNSTDSTDSENSTGSTLGKFLLGRVVTKPNPTLDHWHQLLWAYGPRKLTKTSDKLPALSGLARIFSERLNDQYVAGLWRNSLIEGLLWQGLRVHRVPEYRAPSWSWASVEGIPATGLTENWEPLATIIDCHVEVKGSNPYGEVKSGWIKLQAPLEPLFLDERIDPDGEGVPYARNPKVRTEKGNPNGEYSRFDVNLIEGTDEDAVALVQSLKNVKIFALILAKEAANSDQEGSFIYHSLIVCPTEDGSQSMRRLGFVIQDEDALGSCDSLDPSVERPTITLV